MSTLFPNVSAIPTPDQSPALSPSSINELVTLTENMSMIGNGKKHSRHDDGETASIRSTSSHTTLNPETNGTVAVNPDTIAAMKSALLNGAATNGTMNGPAKKRPRHEHLGDGASRAKAGLAHRDAGSIYKPRFSDPWSRVNDFHIIESTLREGEQFANAFFDTETKLRIAKALDDFGVEYIEITSPAASEQSRLDCIAICNLGLKAKILTHVRCHMDDARLAVETGVDGLDVVIGTSSYLREFSHGKDIEAIIRQATEVITFIKSKGLEVRFSSEDSFRSDLVDLLNIYRTVDKIGVDRVGIADTVGCANPRQVYDLVRTLRSVVSCDIECHFHDDTGCAVANAYAALEAGATHIDTSVLGIGERNGITSLGGLCARMYTADRDYVMKKYRLEKLRDVENLVAEAVQIQVPFNNYITGYCAFTHKAGIHAKAILNNPSTYEILKPEDFGMTRYVSIGHRLTGWNAVKNRAQQLGLSLTDDQVKDVTNQIKTLADIKPLGIEEVDTLLRNFHEKMTGPPSPSAALLAASTDEEEAEGK